MSGRTRRSDADDASSSKSGVVQMLVVAGVAFALGALALYLFDPLGGRSGDDGASRPSSGPTEPGVDPPPIDPTIRTTGPGTSVGTIETEPQRFVTDSSLAETLAAPDGAVLQLVRAGTFLLGTDPPEGQADEHPQRSIGLPDFYIDTTEVTVGSYRKCVNEGGCNAAHFTAGTESAGCNFGVTGRDNHPMNCVSADGAEAFCSWRSSRDVNHDFRLPTEAEWEKAARGSDGRTFPWGSQVTTCALAQIGGCGSTSGAVATQPSDISPVGVMDLGGRVSEWVLAVYDQPLDESLIDVPNAITRNLRGGNWRNRAPVRAADRDAEPVPLGFGTDSVGFRCVATAD